MLPYGHFSGVHRQIISPHSSQTSPVNLYYAVLLLTQTGSASLFPLQPCVEEQHGAEGRANMKLQESYAISTPGIRVRHRRAVQMSQPGLEGASCLSWTHSEWGYLEHGVVALVGLQGPAMWI